MSMENGLEGLEKLRKNAERLSGEHQVKLGDLLNNDFISECSAFKNLEELLAASGYKVESPEDFAAIPDDEWDNYIRRHTSYASWQEMQQAAALAYTKKQMLKGL